MPVPFPPKPMPPSHRIAVAAGLLGWAAVVAVLTLVPAGYTPPLTWSSFLCIGCGWRHVADIILNWLLFMPGGLLLARLIPGRTAVVIALVMTVAIETLQVGIPGRDPALQDLVFNTLGTVSGIQVARVGFGPRARLLLMAAVATAWLAPPVLLVPLTSTVPRAPPRPARRS